MAINLSPKERLAAALAKQAQPKKPKHQKKGRQKKTPEQRLAARHKAQRAYRLRKMAKETPAQREVRLAKSREYNAMRKQGIADRALLKPAFDPALFHPATISAVPVPTTGRRELESQEKSLQRQLHSITHELATIKSQLAALPS